MTGKNMKTATIMDIQRYSIHDGPGIRTTVFFKGCHMACAWCHNPESQNGEPEMLYYEQRCIGCGSCLRFCPRGAHSLEGGNHRVDLRLCRDCVQKEACSGICPSEALRMCGRRMTAEQVLEQVLKDRDFYGGEGGVTCSGGEPLLQSEFLGEFLPLCKKNGISVCLDTTLNVDWRYVQQVLPWTDLFLADIKFMVNEKHVRYTGIDGSRSAENLLRLSERGIPVILRMPLAAGLNDTREEAASRRKLLDNLENVWRVDCFAVTNHGLGKYRALQRPEVKFNQGIDYDEMVGKMKEKMGLRVLYKD